MPGENARFPLLPGPPMYVLILGLILFLGAHSVRIFAEDWRQAQIARRATTSVGAFLVPLIVRSLREADALGEALVARGVDD